MSEWKVTGAPRFAEGVGMVYPVTKGGSRFDVREQEELEALLAGWQPIETAPEDGSTHVRGLWVRCARKDAEPFYYWESDIGSISDEGEFLSSNGDDFGWRADDYTHWMPEPKPAVPPPTN